MNQVLDYIEDNLHEPLTLQDIAKQFYLSEFHFSRLFKMLTGVNLKPYITGRKLTMASKSLRASDNTVGKAI
jgi:AraC-like DNA-binding protein